MSDYRKIFKVIFLFLILVLFVIVFILALQNTLRGFFPADFEASASGDIIEESNVVAEKTVLPKPILYETVDAPFALDARSAAVISVEDLGNKIIFGQSENKTFPIASLTKIMTALVVLENYNLEDNVVVSSSAMAEVGEQGVLKEGDVLKVKDLLYITLMESSNRAAKALSEIMGTDHFIALMNEEAKWLGLNNTYFADATGISPNSYGSAADVAKMTQIIFNRYPLFREIIGTKEYDVYNGDGTLHHKLENTNQLLYTNGIIGGKTGFTAEAMGCFMVIRLSDDGSNYLVYVVLGASDRFYEMEKLIRHVN